MNKLLLILFTFLCCGATASAQYFQIQKSAEFDAPESDWNKLLQMKNGNTLYFYEVDKKGMVVVIYDKNRKQIASQTIISEKWDPYTFVDTKICGLYEIGGEAVLFLYQYSKHPVLYRIRINAANGSMIAEDELGQIDIAALGWHYVLSTDMGGVSVDKDQKSDCYAVSFRDFIDSRYPQTRVCHYDGTHKKLSEAKFIAPPGFKSSCYNSVVVDGNKCVYLLSSGFMGKYGADNSCKLIFSRLKVGETSFKNNIIHPKVRFEKVEAQMYFNRDSNKIQLLTLSLVSKKSKMMSDVVTSYFEPALTYLDPETLEVTDAKQLMGRKTTEYAHQHIDKDYNYSGLPQQMVINKDNSITLLMEEMRSEGKITTLGAAGVSELSASGDELSGYVINKTQTTEETIPLLNMANRRKGIYKNGRTTEYTSFDYIDAAKGRYVIFNDIPSNYDKDEDERKRKTMYSAAGSNAICFKFNNNSLDKSFLFVEPDKKKSAYINIASSDYNKDSGNYAILVTELDGRNRKTYIAWITFE